jgi:hypothetical protein
LTIKVAGSQNRGTSVYSCAIKLTNCSLLTVVQLAQLLITRFTPILAFPLEGKGTSSLPLEEES